VDDDNSSYQVFLRFNFEFGEAKEKPRAVSTSKSGDIKTIKATLETKEDKEAKEVDNVEQTINELLAADIEALEELNQATDQKTNQDLPDVIKILDVNL